MGEKKYSVILADPPWHYRVYSKKGMGRSAESHYPTMDIEDIKALPVADIADKDCALFLWVTFPICTNFSGIPINQGLSASQTVQNIAKTL